IVGGGRTIDADSRSSCACPSCRPDADEYFVGARFELRVFDWYGPGLEAGIGHQAEPLRPRKQPLSVAIPFNAHAAITVPQQVGVVDNVGCVGRIGIPRPLEIPERAIGAVVTAAIGGGSKVLADVIGC